MNKYFTAIERLANIKRYSAHRVNQEQRVDAHSFSVTAICLYIAKKDTDFGSEQMVELLMKAILHDLPEAFMGDIPSPTKKYNERTEEVLKDIERKLIAEIVEDAGLSRDFKDAMEYCKDGEPGEIVALADIIDRCLYLTMEIDSGNRLSKDMYTDTFNLLKTPKYEHLLAKYPSAMKLIQHYGKHMND